jgi:hypothetical protein
MRAFLILVVLVVSTVNFNPRAARAQDSNSGHYMFVWIGDTARKGTTF